MIEKLILALCLCVPAFGQGILAPILQGAPTGGVTFIPVQGAVGVSGSSTDVGTAAFSAPTTTGNAIIAGCAVYGSAVTMGTMTDTAGDTFVPEGVFIGGIGSNVNTEIFHAYNITGHASNVVNCDFAGGTFENVIAAEEISGLLTSGALDGTCGSNSCGANNSATTSYVSGTTGATTQASEIAVGWFALLNSGTAPTFTQGSGWTAMQSGNSGTTAYAFMLEYKILSSTGTQQATATLNASGTGTGQVSTYK